MPSSINELVNNLNILHYFFFLKGMSISLTGPCLLDLQHTVHTDTQHIAMIYTARSTGYLIGAIIGIIYNYNVSHFINSDVTLLLVHMNKH